MTIALHNATTSAAVARALTVAGPAPAHRLGRHAQRKTQPLPTLELTHRQRGSLSACWSVGADGRLSCAWSDTPAFDASRPGEN